MKYKEAQALLRQAIKEQETISTKKLARILESMNISITSDNTAREVKLLKQEITNLHKTIQKLKKRS